MRRAGVAGAGFVAIAIAGAVAAQPTPRPTPRPSPSPSPSPTPTPSPSSVLKFDHAAHGARKVDVATCAACHAANKDGSLVPPGANGHQPCLASGCHVDDFLASGARTAKDDPARHGRATAFCRGCHASAPDRSSKATADAAWKNDPAPDHHIELDHLAHTARTACRSCHAVDAASFALVAGAPGHAQCAACHGTSQPEPSMNACQACHRTPAPAAYFAARRPTSDVRSCGTEAHAALSKPGAAPAPCFRHERVEHRGGASGTLQCGACHFMVADEKAWGKQRYRSLKDLRAAPVIHNDRDRAHAACGAAGCHAKDVVDSRGTARCQLCHSTKAVAGSIFD